MATETITLREELKAWEKQFKTDNGGRKPSREDIKSNASIAAKYKLFNSLRNPENNTAKRPIETPKKASRTRDIPDNALRERAPNAAAATPSRREPKPVETVDQQPILSPVKEEQPTPAFIRSALGPTPQRDGHVLGIFDMLPTSTPSKRSPSPTNERSGAIHGTPSKSASRSSALSRTPQSSSKRHYLDAFITTPGKRKRGTEEEDDEACPPSSSKKLFATPSFLRRVSHPMTMAPIGEEEDDSALMRPPPGRRGKPLARSFSAIIQDLRNQEEERMDDEWDIMNELEAEEAGTAKKKNAEQVQVEDSQGVEMPLGPDQAPEESESEDEQATGALGANGLPRKAYKKKGQKRQTRRANLKPVLHRPRKEGDLEVRGEESEGEEEGGDLVAETQVDDGESRPSAAATVGGETTKSANPVKRAAQKVSQNFRRLKINHPNSKGKGGGRFGRRR